MHERHAVAPIEEDCVPAAHPTQLEAAVSAEKVLDPQRVHALTPDAEYEPAAQLAQEIDVEAPNDERYVPMGHTAQAVAPETIWYCPAGQLVQEDVPLPAENIPFEQAEHKFDFDPELTRKDPAEQPTHDACPRLG